jgi:hypothetical protein
LSLYLNVMADLNETSKTANGKSSHRKVMWSALQSVMIPVATIFCSFSDDESLWCKQFQSLIVCRPITFANRYGQIYTLHCETLIATAFSQYAEMDFT